MVRGRAHTNDVREGGRWTWGQRLKNDVLFALAMGALAVATRLPRRVLLGAGVLLGSFAWLVLGRTRATATRNLRAVFPDKSEPDVRALVRRNFRTLGRYLGTMVASLRNGDAPLLLPLGERSRACLDRALARGRGVVLASGHLGPWESVAWTLAHAGVPLTVVAREAYDPRFDALYAKLRDRRGVRTIYRGRRGAGMQLVRALRRGDVLGVPMDLASRVETIDAPFLGRPAPTPVGPARLALRTGAAVLVATPAQGPMGLVLDIREIPTDMEFGRPVTERQLTERINEELGARILAMPEGWVWMHERWPARRRTEGENEGT